MSTIKPKDELAPVAAVTRTSLLWSAPFRLPSSFVRYFTEARPPVRSLASPASGRA